MPISPLALTTRSGAGAALTQVQGDANWTAIQTAVNALISQVAAKHNDDGTLKTGAVGLAAQVTDAILTIAKFAALTGGDKGALLRSNASSGAIEAAHLFVANDDDTTVINATGAATTALSAFSIASVPRGDVLAIVNLLGLRNAGANGGTISLLHGANVLDQVATHGLDATGSSWQPFALVGVIQDFAGGTLALDVEFETSEGTSDLTFGATGEARFGRRLRVLAGL